MSARVANIEAETFFAAVRDMSGCAHTKRRFLRLLESFAGSRIYIPRSLLRARQAEQAAAMLRSRMRRVEVARALCDRYGFSEATAYRLVRQALDINRLR